MGRDMSDYGLGVCDAACSVGGSLEENNVCDVACNTAACHYDAEDCYTNGTSPVTAVGLTGAGMIVAVADSGLDTHSPFFSDPLQTVAYDREGVMTNPAHRKVRLQHSWNVTCGSQRVIPCLYDYYRLPNLA